MLSISSTRKEFASSEHRSLGNVKLYGLSADFQNFAMPGGAKLSFGEIIALAGDFFGIALDPISLGSTEKARRSRFLAAYATLADCAPANVYRITNEIALEYNDAKLALAEDKTEACGINKITEDETKIYLETTKGNYLLLAAHNLDHFNHQALVAYQTGYTLAMEAAVAAGKLSDPAAQQKQLEYAYTLLAFSSHFMTDLFASGHIRTPRAELEAQFGPDVGSLLTLFQHNEDGDQGLEVQAGNVGDNTTSTWTAYGDGHLFEKKSKDNQDRALKAVQESANELYQAFLKKEAVPFSQSVVVKLIPDVIEKKHSPMFKLGDNNNLLCRIPMGVAASNEYVELTRLKAIEILAYHGENYLESTIKTKIAAVKKKLEAEEAKAKNGFCHFLSNTIFCHSKQKQQAKDEKPVIGNSNSLAS